MSKYYLQVRAAVFDAFIDEYIQYHVFHTLYYIY